MLGKKKTFPRYNQSVDTLNHFKLTNKTSQNFFLQYNYANKNGRMSKKQWSPKKKESRTNQIIELTKKRR